MLQSLQVKNLALIRDAEVEFGPGLNILTGETGAGKSLLMGSALLALGGKFDASLLRGGADSVYVELVFQDEEGRAARALTEMGIEPDEDGTLILSRKCAPGKSICRINSETVTAKQLREVSGFLIGIHGQHEHETLLHRERHLEILDAFIGREITPLKEDTAELYRKVKSLREELSGESLDAEAVRREQSLAEFELREIENAKLNAGEDEDLERDYRRMVNAQRIAEGLSEVHRLTGSEESTGAGESLSHALRALRSVASYDPALEGFEEELSQIDGMLSDFGRSVASYLSDLEFDQETFRETEARLDLINRLKDKYGRTIPDILDYAEGRRELLEKYAHYDEYTQTLRLELQEQEEKLKAACRELTQLRKKKAKEFSAKLREILKELNFLSVSFEVSFEAAEPGPKGADSVEFLLSTNPGEQVRPLQNVASGGELSRIMLGIKTLMAGRDGTGTLIFDEIDAGISGVTAWKVAEQLGKLSASCQIICITHLPQIAAMADTHFVIEKGTEGEQTVTRIRELPEKESIAELARLLGADEPTEEALENARKLKERAAGAKK